MPFPLHTLTSRLRIAPLLHRLRTHVAAAKMRRMGLDRLLANRVPEALPQDPADLMFLYRIIGRRGVRRAIEFGSGQSTLFIAQALHDQGFGHLWSLDADARWLDHTAAMLPAHLRPFVTLVHSPVEVTLGHGEPAWRYSIVPEGKWDFALVDGPTLTPSVRCSCDLVELAPRLNPGAVGMIDHRWRTAVLAKQMVAALLRLRFAPSLESFVFERA